MKKVWKFTLPEMDAHRDGQRDLDVQMPAGAEPLCVLPQGAGFCLWALVNPDQPLTDARLFCVGTGFGDVPDHSKYISTVQWKQFVWHIFQRARP